MNIPDPGRYADWRAWAKDFQKSVTRSAALQPVTPQIVLLSHLTGSPTTSANVSGIMLFDPELGCPIISVDGQWMRVVLQPL